MALEGPWETVLQVTLNTQLLVVSGRAGPGWPVPGAEGGLEKRIKGQGQGRLLAAPGLPVSAVGAGLLPWPETLCAAVFPMHGDGLADSCLSSFQSLLAFLNTHTHNFK